jgi:hypothetical protein
MTRGDLPQTLATIALLVAVAAGAVVGVDVVSPRLRRSPFWRRALEGDP